MHAINPLKTKPSYSSDELNIILEAAINLANDTKKHYEKLIKIKLVDLTHRQN